MNFYNPYFYTAPSTAATSIFSKIKVSSIINGTTKFLNFANQTIPIFKQVTPVMRNAKTMFKLLNEFKKNDTDTNIDHNDIEEQRELIEPEVNSTPPSGNHLNTPTFFA